MLNAVSAYTDIRGIASGVRSAAMTGKSFGDILSDRMSGENVAAVPKSWRESGRTGNVFEAVAEYLSSVKGIDINERTPTYEITDEQADWLRSRHDLGNIGVSGCGTFAGPGGSEQFCVNNTDEYDDLMGDLVYLGVIAPEDAKTLNGFIVPDHPILLQVSDDTDAPDYADEKADSFIEAIKRMIDKQKEMIGLVTRKASDPSRWQPEDDIYLERANAFLEKKQKVFSVLQKLFEKEAI